MTDLSKLVEYDQTYPVEIKHPLTGEPIGFTISVVSDQSRPVAKAVQAEQNKRIRELVTKEGEQPSEEENQEYVEALQRAALIASIVSWNWGEHTFGEINAESECNLENKTYLVDHPNSVFITEQLKVHAGNLRNFSTASEKPSRRKSSGK